MTTNQTLTAIDGIRVGHAQSESTGCTVILCPPNTVGGVDQRGGAPGTTETDLLRPMHSVNYINAIVLSGGSAYGLDSTGGVKRYLEAHGIGFNVGVGVVPIVPGAIIFDLDIGDPTIRPDAAMGYAACEAASAEPIAEGCVGAGVGAKVGALAGPNMSCKSGIGSALIELDQGVLIGALFVVNAMGDVYDKQGHIIAGTRLPPEGREFANSLELMKQNITMTQPGTNTVIGVVATNATLSKEAINKVAQMAHDGLAQAIRPTHTMYDGDTVFALATGSAVQADVSVIGTFAAEATAMAIRRAVQQATPMFNLPTGPTLKE